MASPAAAAEMLSAEAKKKIPFMIIIEFNSIRACENRKGRILTPKYVWNKKGYLAVFCTVVLAVHLDTFARQWFHWPFSNYTMFARPLPPKGWGNIRYRLGFPGSEKVIPVNQAWAELFMFQGDVSPDLWKNFRSNVLGASDRLDAKDKLFLFRAGSLKEFLKSTVTISEGMRLLIEYSMFSRDATGRPTESVVDAICIDAMTFAVCSKDGEP